MKQFTFAILTTLCIWFVMPSQSQAQEYEVGTKAINVGIGFGGYTGSVTGRPGSLGFGSPTISFSGEFGIKETGDFGVIGVGAFVGIRSGKYGGGTKYSSFTIAPRATYHFTVIDVEKLDVYAAVQVDILISSYKYDFLGADEKVTNSYVRPSLIAGARYYFNDSMAGFVELGANGSSVATIGLTFRF